MNKKNTRLFLALLFIVVGILIYYLNTALKTILSNQSKLIDINNPEAIYIKDNFSTTSAKLTNNLWMTSGFPSDIDKIDSLLNKTLDIKEYLVVSKNPNKFEEFGIREDKYIQINNVKIYIGDQYGYLGNYIKINDEDVIYGVDYGFDEFFNPVDLRDFNIHMISSDQDVSEIYINNNISLLSIKKNKYRWKVNFKEAKEESINLYLNNIKKLKANNIQKKEDVNLSTMSAQFEIRILEKDINKEFKIYRPNDNSFYLTEDKNPYIFTIDDLQLSTLDKSEKNFLD